MSTLLQSHHVRSMSVKFGDRSFSCVRRHIATTIDKQTDGRTTNLLSRNAGNANARFFLHAGCLSCRRTQQHQSTGGMWAWLVRQRRRLTDSLACTGVWCSAAESTASVQRKAAVENGRCHDAATAQLSGDDAAQEGVQPHPGTQHRHVRATWRVSRDSLTICLTCVRFLLGLSCR